MAISPKQDLLVFGTDANQVMKVQINLERPHEADRYEYLISSFHSKSIIGMDVCIKKNIVATCSTDRTVRIWSFDSAGKLIVPSPQKKDAGPLVKTFQEETYSLALHPSGFHIVIGFADCVKMMNILSNNLEPFKNIQIKNCKEIQFSHGGQYFACQSGQNIQVFKFYTGETNNDFFFRGHDKLVKSISWLEDDTGFVSCGWDQNVILWKLYPDPTKDEKADSHVVWNFSKMKNCSFNCVAIYRPTMEKDDDFEPVVYASCSDKSIREIKTYADKKDQPSHRNWRESGRYEDQTTIFSQVLTSFQRKFMVAGVAEPDKPASIQIFRQKFEKVLEV